MRKFSKVLLSSLILSVPAGMAACSNDDSNNPSGEGGSTTDHTTSSTTDHTTSSTTDHTTSSTTDHTTSSTTDHTTGGGAPGTTGGGAPGTTDDTDSATGGGANPSDCEFVADGLFCLEDCLDPEGPTENVLNAKYGAFVDDPTWMEGWTNWSRDSSGVGDTLPLGDVGCTFDRGETCAWLSEDIADDMTLSADKVWGLSGPVHIKDGVTLTIKAGSIIKGDRFTKGSLVVSRGGKLMAEGTAKKPIVFTSSEPDGDKAKGQWGGVILLGKASNWMGGNVQIEGLADDPANQYGADAVTNGSTDDDNSGSLKYVRIEFGGVELTTDNEINGLTLGSIGSKTKISHVQVNTTLDDGVEFFGGTVNIDHFVVNNAGDDNFDTDQGYRGTMDTLFARQIVPSTSDPNGFEWDSDKAQGESGVGRLPVSHVTAKNATLCGTGKVGKPNFGMVLRENITGVIDNLAFTGFDYGIDTRDNFLDVDTKKPKVKFTNSASWNQQGGISKTEKAGSDADNDMGFDEAAWFQKEKTNVDLDK